MFKYSIVVEVSPDTSFKSMEELVEAIKLWRGVRNVELQNASQQPLAPDACAMRGKCAEVGVDDFGKCWNCGKPRR
jgi:hypothetical protein